MSDSYLLQFPEVTDAPPRGTGNNYEMCLRFEGPNAEQDVDRVRDFLVAVLRRCGIEVDDHKEHSGAFTVHRPGSHWPLEGMIWRESSHDSFNNAFD